MAAIVGMFIYLPSLGYELTYDDVLIIKGNSRIHDLAQPRLYLATSYWDSPGQNKEYRPLALLSYAINWAVAGDRPFTYRAFNLLLHGAVIWLLGTLVLALVGSTRMATLAAALFALHPIHVEVVAGVVGRAELMASAGFLGGLLCAWHSLNAPAGPARWRWAAALGSCALLAMGSKENGLTLLPALALLPLAVPVKGSARVSVVIESLRALIPCFIVAGAVAAIYLIARIAVLGGISGPPGMQQIVSYDNPLIELQGMARTLSALKMLGRYALMLVWPFHQSPDYSYGAIPLVLRMNDPSWILGALICPVFLVGLLALRRRPASLIGVLLFFVTFILTSNLFFPIGVMLAERLLYLPSVGFCIVAADLGACAWDRAGLSGRKILQTVAVVVGLAFLAQTWRYQPVWKNNKTLFTYMAERVPGSARANVNYSLILIDDKKYDEAEKHLNRALEIMPGQPLAMAKLGEVYYKSGQKQKAALALEKLDASFQTDPGNPDTVKYLTRLYFEMKRADKAGEVFRRALEFNPRNHSVRSDYGRFLEMLGRHADAIGQLEQYLADSGIKSDKWAYESLARSYKATGDLVRAKHYDDLAAPLAPPDAE